MILAIDDASGLRVFENLGDVSVHCEAIDVENNVYEFWDDDAQRLRPRFATRRWWRFEWVVRDTFELVAAGKPDPGAFRQFLARAKYLEEQPVSRFRALEDLRAHLTGRLQATPSDGAPEPQR